jgi:hypothetical protein
MDTPKNHSADKPPCARCCDGIVHLGLGKVKRFSRFSRPWSMVRDSGARNAFLYQVAKAPTLEGLLQLLHALLSWSRRAGLASWSHVLRTTRRRRRPFW